LKAIVEPSNIQVFFSLQAFRKYNLPLFEKSVRKSFPLLFSEVIPPFFLGIEGVGNLTQCFAILYGKNIKRKQSFIG